ncbi:U32 family peptidase, partial [Desulfobacterales bacterium HSG16]|nr:U32 family peptidase [Desulfobacterales bacterium HSG16]
EGSDPKMKKAAMQMLDLALGREKTHYNFLPQRQYNPIPDDTKSASGRLIAQIKGSRKKPYIEPREPLFAEDVLRIGNEDIAGHEILRLKKYVPGKGRFYLNLSKKKFPASDTPVFLCDRREPALSKMIRDLENRLPAMPESVLSSSFTPGFSKSRKQKGVKTLDVLVSRHYKRPSKGKAGLWVCEDSVNKIPKKGVSDTWWWLPPVIWPKDEETFTNLVKIIIGKGGRTFVCNAPWQTCFFEGRKNFELWAGPFCNIANGLAADMLASFGFTGAVVSPELARDDFLNLPEQISSSLSLGIVLSGLWPLCISRTVSNRLDFGKPFSSPKKEDAWAVSHEKNTWVFPNWRLDLESEKKRLQNAGYSVFVHMNEDIPNSVHMKNRPGMWNWNLKLL